MSGGGAVIGDARRATVGIPSTTLGDSGYTVCRTGRGDHLVLDTGPHGYLNGGHAHADALSMTLTVAGRPLLVDPGTACYTVDPSLRDRFRSTRLHNTLVLDGREQSEPAGPFHWASAAAGSRLAWCTSPGFDYVEGTHDGYAPLVHRRAVFSRPGCWIVADRVLGDGTHQAEVHWHLDPRWTVTAAGDGWLRADDGAGDPVWMTSLDGEFEIVRGRETGGELGLGWVAPAYGHVVPSTTLRLVRRGAAPFTLATVLIEATDRPSIDALPVRVDGVIDPTAAGLRLIAAEVTDTVVFGSATSCGDGRAHMPRRRVVCGHLESDAALLWCRARASQPETHVAIVDGRVVRTVDGRDLVTLPAPVAFRETVA
jgi:hypothetical protein